MTERVRLQVRGVKKAFGPTAALRGIELDVRAGEVHAILGENGAGKSTLNKILAGALTPDAGTVLLDGEPFHPSDPHQAHRSGVAIVYQEPALCPHLTVAENVLLGAEPARWGFVRGAVARRKVEQALSEVVGSELVLPNEPLWNLSLGERQLVAIARALAQTDCRVLILDEPTSSLTAEHVERLFTVVRRLKQRGLAILYVSHFLEEVQAIADSYTVLRDGENVGSGVMAETNASELVGLMAGRRIELLFHRSPRTPGDLMLEVKDLAGEHKPVEASLELYSGEVLGVAGLVGSGRTELVRAIFGLDLIRSGKIRVGVFAGPASPMRRWAQGVGVLSEDRKGEGLAESLTLAENITLSKLRGLGPIGFVWPHRQMRAAQTWVERFGIVCRSVWQRAEELSGGNQQKLALARLLYHDVDVFLLDEPTRGIDVASRAQVYQHIDELASRGKAVLMVSSYLPELLGVCDRIAVMRRGRLGRARPVSELDEHAVLMEATQG